MPRLVARSEPDEKIERWPLNVMSWHLTGDVWSFDGFNVGDQLCRSEKDSHGVNCSYMIVRDASRNTWQAVLVTEYPRAFFRNSKAPSDTGRYIPTPFTEPLTGMGVGQVYGDEVVIYKEHEAVSTIPSLRYTLDEFRSLAGIPSVARSRRAHLARGQIWGSWIINAVDGLEVEVAPLLHLDRERLTRPATAD